MELSYKLEDIVMVNHGQRKYRARVSFSFSHALKEKELLEQKKTLNHRSSKEKCGRSTDSMVPAHTTMCTILAGVRNSMNGFLSAGY